MIKQEEVSVKCRVFLGGTCNGTTWREELKPMLEIDYFDPVVDDWTDECMAEEIKQRKSCEFVLYVITPKMAGVYSIAEAVDDSNKQPEKTVFCVLDTDSRATFNKSQMKSLAQVGKMIERNGSRVFTSLMDTAYYLNKSTCKL